MGVVLWADVSDEEVIGFQRAHWRVLSSLDIGVRNK